ncbi:MAG: metallophosphoesterase, partial [Gemmatimonadota bacterium]|nr:metallophosphoesterase [Gemmatimonadota bacterium]
MKLVHASDLHFGKPHLPVVAAALLRFIDEAEPDAVVVSGDLTQRAKVAEFEAASAYLDQISPIPLVTTLGNHDVPVYRVFERLLSPYRNYRTHISPDLDTVTDVEGTRIVALSTAAPY